MRPICLLSLVALSAMAQSVLVLSKGPSQKQPYQSAVIDSITISVNPPQTIRIQVTSLAPWLTFTSDCDSPGKSTLTNQLTPVTITYCADPSQPKSEGYYTGLIEATAAGFTPLRVPIKLQKVPPGDILATPEPIQLTPSQNTATITITAQKGSGNNPTGASVAFATSLGQPTLAEGNWLSYSQVDAATTGRVNVKADLSKITSPIPYTYTTTVQYQDKFGDIQASTINFTVTAQDLAPPPVTSPTGALAHLAAGNAPPEGWVTGISVVNNGTQSAQYSIAFYDDKGNSITLPFGGAPTPALKGTLNSQGSAYFESSSGSFQSGWGQITADPSIVIQALFRRHAADGNYYEAAVASTSGSKEFLIPFIATTFLATGAQIYTGFAIANLDPAVSATVACTARDSSGNVIPNALTIDPINPLGHWQGYLFPPLTGKTGTIDCASNTNVAATAFRFLGTNALSSLPVITK